MPTPYPIPQGPVPPPGQPPGPHDPPDPKRALPDGLSQGVFFPGMLSWKPVETCRHGFHGAVAA